MTDTQYLWGHGGADEWRQRLKAEAFNTQFVPPEDEIHLARLVILHLASDRDRLKHDLIASRKEISRLKRQAKPAPADAAEAFTLNSADMVLTLP